MATATHAGDYAYRPLVLRFTKPTLHITTANTLLPFTKLPAIPRPRVPKEAFAEPPVVSSIAALNSFVATHLLPTSLPLLATPKHVLRNVSYNDFLLLCRHRDSLATATIGCAKIVRLSYNGQTSSATISCPTLAHEVVSSFADKMELLLEADGMDFYGNVWASAKTHRIISSGSASIPLVLNGIKSLRQPDGSLRVKGDDVPFLVCEVADTQTTKELMQLAAKYIVGTTGGVRLVILVKLERDRKRKRGGEEGGVEEGALAENKGKPGETSAAATDEERQETASILNPTLGDHTYDRGLFWVYTSRLNPQTKTGRIICLEQEQEFYPTPPTTHLSLTWSSIIDPSLPMPDHIKHKEVKIPYRLLTDLLLDSLQAKLPDCHAAKMYSFNAITEDTSSEELLDGSSDPPREFDESDTEYIPRNMKKKLKK